MEANMPTPEAQRALPCRWFSTSTLPSDAAPDFEAPQPTLFLCDLPPEAQKALRGHLDDEGPAPDWTEDDIVQLHWRLLLELRKLPDPETPLEEKFDTLAWALTDPSLDNRPFSFASCLKVVGTSPLSPTAYFGSVQVDDIRDWVRAHVRQWVGVTLWAPVRTC
jgi:hypothetical protein